MVCLLFFNKKKICICRRYVRKRWIDKVHVLPEMTCAYFKENKLVSGYAENPFAMYFV